MVMHDRADDVRQQAAASGAGAVEGEPGSRRDMHPSSLAADAKAGLVHVLDGCGGDAIAHRSDEILQAGGAAATDLRDVPAAILTPNRSAISSTRRSSGSS
jgi:hypothetical protein